MENKENKLYQLTCLFKPSIETEKMNQIMEEIKQLIISNGGNSSEKHYSNNPIKRRIAYPIKKQEEAFYWDFVFSISPNEISKIKEMLRHKKDIIRNIITKKKELKHKLTKKDIDLKIIDKIEPLVEKIEEKEIDKERKKERKPEKEKTKIEDLDKKLEEILNQ